MKSSFAARGILSGVALLAAAAMFFVAFGAVGADATSPKVSYSGNATFAFGSSKSGKVLRGKVFAISPAKAKRQRGKLYVNAPVRSFGRDVTLAGGIRFKAGKRKIAITGLIAKVGQNRTVVKGKLGKKAITAFKVSGRSVTSGDTANGTVRITTGKLALSGAAARGIKKALKLKSLPAGKVGDFSLFAKVTTTTTTPNLDPCVTNPTAPGCQPPIVDPYMAQCGVAATSKVTGTATPAAALPTLSGEVVPVSDPVDWGVRQGLRGYLSTPAFGVIEGLNGATVNRIPGPPLPVGFSWPAAGGQYAPNSASTFSDDQAIINGTGSILLCHKEQFRILISNPTIVLDGDNSRLIADIDTNNKGVWTETQRVDLVDVDVSGVTPDVRDDANKLTWEDVPTALTEAGSEALTLCDAAPGAPGGCDYGAGAAMDALTFSVTTENPVALCSITSTTGFGIQPNYVPATSPPALTGTDTVGGGLEWGFRTSLRSTVQGGGNFGLANGALRSDPVSMKEESPTPDPTQKYFTWPSVEGNYDEVASGDDRLVLQGRGNVSFCNVNFGGYGILISNPTVVVDGADSFVSADVSVRQGPDWASGRVDVARFDLSGVDPTAEVGTTETELSWEVPAADVVGAGPDGSASPLLNALGAGGPTGFNWLRINATIENATR